MNEQLHFLKMHGCGNDYVFVDCLSQPVPPNPGELAVRISDRHTSVGADGLVLLLPSDVADVRIRMFNSDGSEGAMCGNAIRCVALWLLRSATAPQSQTADGVQSDGVQPDMHAARTQPDSLRPELLPSGYRIQTQNRVVDATVISHSSTRQSAIVRVNMGPPSPVTLASPATVASPATGCPVAAAIEHSSGDRKENHPPDRPPQRESMQTPTAFLQYVALPNVQLAGDAVTLACVSMGNPHAVIFVSDLTSVPFEFAGPAIENHPAFPDRTNVEFAEVINNHHVRVRVWERGSGETMACGSGACAVAVAGIASGLLHHQQPVLIDMSGGQLQVSWPDQKDVFLQGMASLSFEGLLCLHQDENGVLHQRQLH